MLQKIFKDGFYFSLPVALMIYLGGGALDIHWALSGGGSLLLLGLAFLVSLPGVILCAPLVLVFFAALYEAGIDIHFPGSEWALTINCLAFGTMLGAHINGVFLVDKIRKWSQSRHYRTRYPS